MIEAPCFARRVDDQPVEGDDLDARWRPSPNSLARGRLDQLDALLEGKQRLLAGMDADRRIDRVGDGQRRLEHVEMPVGQRVEGAGIDGDAFGHGRVLLARHWSQRQFDGVRLADERQMNGDISEAFNGGQVNRS